jgi:hypothetical protein
MRKWTMFENKLRRLTRDVVVVTLVAASAVPLLGCHKSKQYETNVEITRMSAVRKDEQGNVMTSDVEFSYVECPGTQIEVIRGGKEFSSCVLGKLKVGDKVKVKLEHHWDAEGFYDYDVYEVLGCARPPDPNDEASYKMVRECSDWNVNGARVGFQCNYQNKKDLNKKCPWFLKR